MDSNAYGMPPYPQPRSVLPQQMGAALAQMQPTQMGAMQPPPPAPRPAMPGQYLDAPDVVGEDEVPSSLVAALREAKWRIQNGDRAQGTNPLPAAPGTMPQLERMGLSPIEIRLLKVSGGIR